MSKKSLNVHLTKVHVLSQVLGKEETRERKLEGHS